MNSPFTGGRTVREVRQVEHAFRKDRYQIFEHAYRCIDTDQLFYTDETDRLNLGQVHNQYRSRHQIPFPAEIKTIRKMYGLSAGKMSEVLGFGINSYRQYEQGEMPSQANAKLIRLASNPDRFEEFMTDRPSLFSDKQQQRINDRIHQQRMENRLQPWMKYLWNVHLGPNEFTGYVAPSFQKVAAFVSFFAASCRPLKTRLNKLLFYADFFHFKQFGFSISGCKYRAIPYGPVPSHFHELFGILQSQGILQIEEEEFSSGHIGERFSVKKPPDMHAFTEHELASMKQVVESFGNMTTRDLIEKSHGELAWISNHRCRDLISYQEYGFRLNGL